MAKKPTIKINYKITDIEELLGGAYLIALELNDGIKTWQKAFRINYGRPISLEEFERDLKQRNLLPDEENYSVYLKEEIGKPHSIEISSKKPIKS
jgi:hypothetical protein